LNLNSSLRPLRSLGALSVEYSLGFFHAEDAKKDAEFAEKPFDMTCNFKLNHYQKSHFLAV